ncbi:MULTISPECIES: CHASE3 domain-containing protein [unclassified Rhizobium]|uniref:CHASE3 domain-containing protein n=1 Tax=unclassified Rhizobium TaxID=2613769 RepID=UPI0006F41599|nr:MULTISPECIES: CHASE3 domain-containing protein [unclassified Rhizobium]KQV43820.1 hypothetical protein ASC86_03200 [Rhizobium sp. Root1212]KRD38003.1 hypothetical protein ASE37_03200 [Rhizobium sp. Root268]
MGSVPTGFSRTVPLSLFAGALLLLGLVVSALVFANMTRNNSAEALRTARLNQRALLLLSLLQDAETNARGYILTGHEVYRTEFERAGALVRLQMDSLRDSLQKNRAWR